MDGEKKDCTIELECCTDFGQELKELGQPTILLVLPKEIADMKPRVVVLGGK